MTPTTDMYLLLRAFVDELARCGMRAACTSPGSRNAPLVLSLAREPRLRCYSHVDERCAGFFALGLAKASGLPVAVTCTSGTAAAELLPAAIEAREARVPLLLLTADRPAELRENGAGQAIDQLKLFGSAAKWFSEVAVHEASEQNLRWMRTLACRAYWTALAGRPGAVHLNFPLREPLIDERETPPEHTGRGDGRPYVVRTSAPPAMTNAAKDTLHELTDASRRGVLVAGRDERHPELPAAAAHLAATAGWPLLADPLSGARRGTAAIAYYDALLRDEKLAAELTPDLVVRLGDLPVSKPLRTWLANMGDVQQVAFDPEGAWQDPASALSHSLVIDPMLALGEMAHGAGGEEGWLARWRTADELTAEAIGAAIGDEQLSDPAVARELGVLLPEHALLFVASSMPVRDIETFWPARSDPPRVLCNRGANGIDGIVSAAFGAAAHHNGPTVLLIGDVALAHDIGGLLAASRLSLSLTIVLLDNHGGGIFDFLAVAGTEEDIYTQHIATPTGLDFSQVAASYGIAHKPVTTRAELRMALEHAFTPAAGPTLVHVTSDRQHNVWLHRETWNAVSLALAYLEQA